MSLNRLWRFHKADIPYDRVARRPGGQPFGSSRQSPNQSDQHHHNGHRHPHSARRVCLSVKGVKVLALPYKELFIYLSLSTEAWKCHINIV